MSRWSSLATEMGARLNSEHGIERGRAVTLALDGRPITAYEGESVATALLAEGYIATRRTRTGARRGIYCGIGLCFDCLLIVDGVPNTRACVTWVREGMDVRRQDGFGALEENGPC
jgi:predicted molibdopterin-dependent oxidoreductase YjgC